jgi:SAM-dependent methyltransferase
MNNKIPFRLPPKGALDPIDCDDPLIFYHRPLVGSLYRKRIAQALSLLTPPYESILEIGYGSGVLMPTLSTISKSVSGIDLNADPRKVTSRLRRMGVNVSLSKGDIVMAGYPDASFDLIVAISIFEHVPDLKMVLDKVFRLLRDGGHLLVGMPRVDSLMNMLFHLIGYHDIKAHHFNDHAQFLLAADKMFRLEGFRRIPEYLPLSWGLYFNMLFKRA